MGSIQANTNCSNPANNAGLAGNSIRPHLRVRWKRGFLRICQKKSHSYPENKPFTAICGKNATNLSGVRCGPARASPARVRCLIASSYQHRPGYDRRAWLLALPSEQNHGPSGGDPEGDRPGIPAQLRAILHDDRGGSTACPWQRSAAAASADEYEKANHSRERTPTR